MTTSERPDLSRPLRLAADLTGNPESELADSFVDGRVMVSIETEMESHADARLTVLSLCNQILRFCPNVIVRTRDAGLALDCLAIATSLRGARHGLRLADDHHDEVDVTVTVGVETTGGPSRVTVNSSGWVARIGSASGAAQLLPWDAVAPNAVGAVAAACLGAGEVFLRLICHPVSPRQHELCMLTGVTGGFGEFSPGPEIPHHGLVLDGLLAGCGGVGNGWAETLRHLPVTGSIGAVDRQVVGIENIGPYVVATISDLGEWKTDMIQRVLAPRITVRSYPEELDLFVPRIARWGLPLAPVVVTGFDEAEPRHTMQRLWPETLIDMAAGGATAQVHVHRAGRGGQCLLGAHTSPADAITYADRAAAMTGLRPDRILKDYNQPINDEDIAHAPEEHRDALKAARRSGVLICGRITRANLQSDDADSSFAPAAPFVAGLSGAMGASMTLQALTGRKPDSGLHWQYNFLSGRSLRLVMSCADDCECRAVGRRSSGVA